MRFETKRDKEAVRKWAILATHLNGAADSGKYDHVTTDVMKREASNGTVFEFLARELGKDVDLTKLVGFVNAPPTCIMAIRAFIHPPLSYCVNGIYGAAALLSPYLPGYGEYATYGRDARRTRRSEHPVP